MERIADRTIFTLEVHIVAIPSYVITSQRDVFISCQGNHNATKLRRHYFTYSCHLTDCINNSYEFIQYLSMCNPLVVSYDMCESESRLERILSANQWDLLADVVPAQPDSHGIFSPLGLNAIDLWFMHLSLKVSYTGKKAQNQGSVLVLIIWQLANVFRQWPILR